MCFEHCLNDLRNNPSGREQQQYVPHFPPSSDPDGHSIPRQQVPRASSPQSTLKQPSSPNPESGSSQPRDNVGRFIPRKCSPRAQLPNQFGMTENVVMPNDEINVGTDVDMGETDPDLHLVAEQLVAEDPSVEPPLLQSQLSEPQESRPRRRVLAQQFERNVRARQEGCSSPSVSPSSSSDAALAFSARSLETSCVCVEETNEKTLCRT